MKTRWEHLKNTALELIAVFLFSAILGLLLICIDAHMGGEQHGQIRNHRISGL